MRHEFIAVHAAAHQRAMQRFATRKLSTVVVHKAVDILRKTAASA
ncbi:hypothetical protein [Paraburkholderia jirisanensis]